MPAGLICGEPATIAGGLSSGANENVAPVRLMPVICMLEGGRTASITFGEMDAMIGTGAMTMSPIVVTPPRTAADRRRDTSEDRPVPATNLAVQTIVVARSDSPAIEKVPSPSVRCFRPHRDCRAGHRSSVLHDDSPLGGRQRVRDDVDDHIGGDAGVVAEIACHGTKRELVGRRLAPSR